MTASLFFFTCALRRRLFFGFALLFFFVSVPWLRAQKYNTTPIFTDDFTGATGSAPDPAKWKLDVSNNAGTGEIETDTASRANSYLDGNGNLVIAILKDSSGKYTSAHLQTSGLAAVGPYGKIEARIQTASTPGLGSAFWSLEDDYTYGTPWPSSGEIDFLEQLGRAPNVAYGTIHGPGYADTGVGNPYDTSPNALSGNWHTYGVLWSPYQVQWYVDGQVYGSLNRANLSNGSLWEFNKPIFLILSAGVGGGFAGSVNSSSIFPQTMVVDYVHVYTWDEAPKPATSLVATALSSSQIQLSWTGNGQSDALYNIYGSTTPNFALDQNTTIIAHRQTATSYTAAGLTPGTTYYFRVAAMNNAGEATPTAQVSQATYFAGAGANGNAIQINAGGYSIGTFQSDVYFSGGSVSAGTPRADSTHPVAVDTSKVTSPAPQEVYESGRYGSSTYTIPHLQPNAAYTVQLDFAEVTMSKAGDRVFNVFLNGMLVLNAFDIFQAAGGKNIAIAETFPVLADANGEIILQFSPGGANQPIVQGIEITPGGTSPTVGGGNITQIAINAGGGLAGSFAPDEDFSGGKPSNPVNAAIDTSAVSNPAPQAVYQSNRLNSSSYAIPGLQANTVYKVRLHFAETYHTAAGQRSENVFINGKQVLTDFDIFAASGAKNKAVIEEFNTLVPENGTLVVSVATVKDNALISGIEAIANPGGTIAPAPPTDLQAVPASNTSATLAWAASASSAATYNLYRSTSSGFSPQDTSATLVHSNLTATTYTDTGLPFGSGGGSALGVPTYYYLVTAVNSAGESLPSSQARVLLPLLQASADGIAMNTGGPAVGKFVADSNYLGGSQGTNDHVVDTSGVANAALAAVYGSARTGGPMRYLFPGLTPNASYTVRIHEAETYFTAPNKRLFNISINNIVKVTDYDIYAQAGGANKAVVASYTVNSDAAGQIAVQFEKGSANTPQVNGIEIVSAGSGNGTVPSVPANVTASAVSTGEVDLSWSASTGVTSYTIFRSTTAGFTASAATQVQAGVTGTTYADRGLAAATTYYYVVEAVNSAGSSGPSVQKQGTTKADVAASFAVNAGGSAIGAFTADTGFAGGSPMTKYTQAVDTAGLVRPAPQQVYQSARQGTSTYTFTGLASGSAHTVRLHFAELYHSAANQRKFNVLFNSVPVLSDFDVFAAAKGRYVGVIQEIEATADRNGTLVIKFAKGSVDQAEISGIEID